MIRKFSIILVAALLVMPAVALAAANTGDQIPHNLELKNQIGELQTFEAISGEKGIVLVFVRSADWCPYCQAQMIELRDNGQAIQDLGYNVVTISYDAPEILKAFTEKYNFPYVMLSDVGSAAIKDFGILNEEFNSDHFAYGVPHPHVYIIGKNKIIRGVLSEEGYKDRPQIGAIVEQIEALD